MAESRGAGGKGSHRILKAIGVIAACAIIVSVTAYVVVAAQYQNKFIEGTLVNGYDVSDLGVDEVEELIREEVEDYCITVVFRDGSEERIGGEEIGYHFVSDGKVEQLLSEQDPLTWYKGRLGSNDADLTAEAKTEYDESLLADVLSSMPQMDQEGTPAPSNAYLSWNESAFVIVPENEGERLIPDAVLAEVSRAIEERADSVTLSEEAYTHPEVYQDDEKLNAQCESANTLISANITYNLPGGDTKTITSQDIVSWLMPDGEGGYVLPEEEVVDRCTAFVQELADKYDTYGKDIPFASQNFGEITINIGEYGFEIDRDAEIQKLSAEVMTHADITREPVFSHTGITMEPGGIGNTYIEVDIASQHVYYFINGELYLDTPVVTGMASVKSRRTPTGVFFLTFKTKDYVMKGRPDPETGNPTYASHVWFWMPFYSSTVGFHDADGWRSHYGGSIYKNNGSHGCVNMPYSAAKKMYEVIDKETPIIVHWQ